MLSRTSERKMRWVRAGLLAAWFVLFCSLFFDPVTPLLTAPDMAGSPFRVDDKTVLLQGEQLRSEPYAMGNRIFWTMVLPLLPLTLMLAGH